MKKPTKRYMAVIIASQLSKKLVSATDWKVKALRKMNQSRLETLYEKAQTYMEAEIELEINWKVALSTLTPKIFKEIDAPGDW